MTWQTIKARIVQALGGTPAPQPEAAQIQQTLPMLPAAFGGDPTLFGYRRLTSSGQDVAALRDLPVMTQERMQQVAYFLYLTNPMAKWVVNTMRDYIVGEEVTLKCTDPATQAVVDAWWNDPVNAWPRKLSDKVKELGLYGEQCYPAFVAQGTGRVRLGYLDPCLIDQVVLDPDNAEQAIGVLTKQQVGAVNVPARKFKVILAIGEDELTPPAQSLRAGFTDGHCFYFAVNKVSNGSRGISDLMASADWLDGYEQFLFQRLERGDLMNRIIFDLKLIGFTQPQIEEFRKTWVLPKPGGTHIHNEKVELNATAPDLKASDASVDARLFKHQCLAGLPEHWFGGGGEVNRATASEMDEPTFKMFGARQLIVKAMLQEMALFSIRQGKAAGTLAQSADEAVQVIFPEMVTADLSKIGAVIQNVSTSIATMILNTVITPSEGRLIYSVVVKGLGVELPAMDASAMADAEAMAQFDDASQDYTQTAQARLTRKKFRVA